MGTALPPLLDALRATRLLDGDQLTRLSREANGFDRHSMLKELVRRGWLTPYQVNQLQQERGQPLLLGSYVLLERLGEGGMGQVFKARNWKLGQVVALKLIHPERVGNAEAVRRFHREIKLAAHLNHPNIVRALDADQVNDTHLLIMEYVEGADLGKIVKQSGRLPIRDACDSVRQAALGLQHAFERGLVHRDIKPSNLLRTTPGGVIKVLDLGLARLVDTLEGNAATNLTQLGHIVGTPDYIAPEQARDSHSADIRSDLYSLGGTLYFLLTGQVPYPNMTATEKLIQAHLSEPQPVEQLRPDVPPGVGAVVRKLMAKTPGARHQTPAELAAELAALLSAAAPRTVTTVKPGRGAATQKAPVPAEVLRAAGAPPRRRARRAEAIAAAVLLLAGVVGVWAVLPRSGAAGRSSAVAQGKESGPQPGRDTRPATTPTRPAAKNPPTEPRPTAKTPESRPTAKTPPPIEKKKDDPVTEVAVLGEPRDKAAVYALALSGTGQLLASGGADDVIHLWDTRTWRAVGTPLRGHTGDIRTLAFSRDGKLLASGGADKNVKLWDVPGGKELATLQGHTGEVRALAFSPDGRTLASGAHQDAHLRIWDVPGRKERHVWPGHDGGVYALAFPAGGGPLASAGADERIRIWDLEPGKEPLMLKGHTSDIISMSYAPDGKKLVTGTSGGLMRVWTPPAKESHHLKGFQGKRSSITALVYSSDGKRLVSTCGKGLLVLWDPEAERPLQEWSFNVPVHSATLGAGGAYVAAGTELGTVHVLRPDP